MINQVPVQGYYFVKIFFFGLTEYHFAHLFTHATPAAIRPGHGRKSSSCRYNRQLESAHSQYRSLPVYFSFSVFFCSSIAFWISYYISAIIASVIKPSYFASLTYSFGSRFSASFSILFAPILPCHVCK